MGDWLEEEKQRTHDAERGFLQAGGILAVCLVCGLFGMWRGGMGLLRAEGFILSLGSLFIVIVSAWIWWKRTVERSQDDREHRKRFREMMDPRKHES